MNFMFRNDWREWWHMRSFNWSTFRVLTLELEYEKAGPQIEVTFVILGIGVCVVVGLPWETKQSQRLEQAVREILPIIESNRDGAR